MSSTTTTTGYAAVNGLDRYYEIHGELEPETLPLVLLDGGISTIEVDFGKILPALAASRQVIGFGMQGHGHTADIDRPLSMEQVAHDVVAALRQLEIA